MSKIAIIDLLFTWPPDGGGRTDLKEFMCRLARDHDVTLLCPDYRQYFPRGEIDGDFQNIEIRKIKFNYLTFNFFLTASRFLKETEAVKPDSVFIGDAWYLKPYLMNALKNYQPVVRFYAYESFCLRKGQFFRKNKACDYNYLEGGLKSSLFCTLCAGWDIKFRSDTMHGQEFWNSLCWLPTYKKKFIRALKTSGPLIVYNSFLADRIKPFNQNVKIVPAGIDPEKFHTESLQSRYSSRIPEKKIITMVGRAYDPTKGFNALYSACRLIRKKRNDFLLQITEKDTQILPSDDFIRSVGWHPQEILADAVYKNSDICVVPSLWREPFGIVALEAMSCGRPVVASKLGGLQHSIVEGKNGLLFEPGNSEELAEKLEFLLDSHETREKMGQAGRNMVLETYNWDKIYENHYKPLFP